MDNCFATKRWTTPDEWARVIRGLGVSCIEASADTEADPFYCGAEYLDEWIAQVEEASAAHGVRVANFYTGYSTYRTLGLAHPDARVRDRVVNDWLKVMAVLAARIGAGLGFYIHAFTESVLQDAARYVVAQDKLYTILAEVARFAGDAGGVPIVVEQMYVPHQVPWTIEGTFEYLREVSSRAGYPAYVALDTGHQTGQRHFLPATREAIERGLAGEGPVPYLGPDAAYALFEKAGDDAASRIEREMRAFPHFFSSEQDCDLYTWLEHLGCWSPILHLQQTDGRSSGHRPFTAAHNAAGIVHPLKVLQAIARSYERPARPGMPRRCDDIYLTFEIFPHTTDRPRDFLPALAESVRYWRQWIPEDGMSLDSLPGVQEKEAVR
jgi:sugar phosphate isomerase/epimerase